MDPSLTDRKLAEAFGDLFSLGKCASLHLRKLLERLRVQSQNSVSAKPPRDPKHKLGCEPGTCGFPLLMSPGWSLNPHHNAGDVCLRPTGRGGFSQLNRLITTNHERGRTYTAGMRVHHTAHISGLGPVFTVYCIALLPSEGRWPFGCITDPNLKFERAVEDTKVVTEKNSGLLCLLTACGSLPTSLSWIWMLVVLWIVSVKASEGVQGQNELPTCVLYFSSLFQILIVLPWHSQCCSALRSVVPQSGLSMWTGQPRLLKMDRKMFYFFFF